MTHSVRAHASFLVVASYVMGAGAIVVGCTKDDDSPIVRDSPPDTSAYDAGVDKGDGGRPSSESDATIDASRDEDACSDGGCSLPKTGCAAFSSASFCDDFDNADALTPNKTKWDFIEPTDQPVATLSTVRAVSAPNSLLSRVIDKDTPGAKFAKTITKSGFTEVTWSYDVYLDSIGTEDGFFLDDFQFSDAVVTDSFGFRLVMFAAAGQIKEFKVEHNQPANGGDYTIEPAFPAGTVTLGQWHHVQQSVKFSFGTSSGGDAGATNKVTYTLRIDESTTPVLQKEYVGITREQAAFARMAGMPLVFNKEKSAGLKIHWDNHVVEMK